MKLAYVCTNYNNSAFTVTAVQSLLLNAGHELEIVVVDNASVEPEVRLLRPLSERHPGVLVIESPENTGYFRGLNIGLKSLRLRRPDIEWIVIGNNDLEFAANFCDSIDACRQQFEAHSVISPDIVTLDGQHQNPHVISHISKFRELVYDLHYANYYVGLLIHKLAKMFPRVSERADEEEWETARPIYQGHGACYLLGPKFFRHFEELWAPTFMMSEELFLSKQLESIGEQVYYDPRVRVTHHWHGSLEKLPSRRRWEMARDAHREYRKYVKVFSRD